MSTNKKGLRQHIVAIANQKGGVAKTTTAINLAAGLVVRGKKVLLLDWDPQANSSDTLGYERCKGNPTITEVVFSKIGILEDRINPADAIRTNDEGIDYIPSTLALAKAENYLQPIMCREYVLRDILKDPVFQQYDFIIIDTNPSIGVITTNALAAATDVIIPVQSEKYAFDGLQDFKEFLLNIQKNLNQDLNINGVLVTMTYRSNISGAVLAAIKDMFGNVAFSTSIRRKSEAPDSANMYRSLVSMKRSALGQEYLNLTDEFIARCEAIDKGR